MTRAAYTVRDLRDDPGERPVGLHGVAAGCTVVVLCPTFRRVSMTEGRGHAFTHANHRPASAVPPVFTQRLVLSHVVERRSLARESGEIIQMPLSAWKISVPSRNLRFGISTSVAGSLRQLSHRKVLPLRRGWGGQYTTGLTAPLGCDRYEEELLFE